ncbi:hypothetical protein HYW75_04980 [Candidatus Pacearchaeota archaeon]|nr:hypothetical protein [Candidatus Pacearchaeota archaeon]
MKSEKLLLFVAIIAVVVSGLSVLFTSISIQDFKTNWITGFPTATGTANLSVESAATINFTVYEINWSSGRVNTGDPNATLDTSAGTVVRGNWTANSRGLILINQGNTNVSLQINTGKTAATFIGGTNPVYQWNVSAQFGNQSACLNATNGTTIDSGAHTFNLSVFTGVSTSAFLVCDKFQYHPQNNTIRIDIRIQVPSNSFTGSLNDLITATATAILSRPLLSRSVFFIDAPPG